jgi:hypothetical protein
MLEDGKDTQYRKTKRKETMGKESGGGVERYT